RVDPEVPGDRGPVVHDHLVLREHLRDGPFLQDHAPQFQMDVPGHGELLEDQERFMTKSDRHLVPIKPDMAPTPCPFCASPDVVNKRVVLPGIHVMADRTCLACGAEYLQDLPVG